MALLGVMETCRDDVFSMAFSSMEIIDLWKNDFADGMIAELIVEG
jgi:hypothetical protein